MKIGNNGNLVLGPFDEPTPCLMIVLMNCQTKLKINHLTAVKSVAILENQKGISQVNMTNLRNLVDTSDEVLRGLKTLGTAAANGAPWLIQIIDAETKRLWSLKTAEKDSPTLKECLEFLNVRC
ncbi:uncharacterized protein TNCV_2830521 [Trichonephila clavipes]|nr:uncharacterized protein TNCV_2830521 [Trichonephila clavipes]